MKTYTIQYIDDDGEVKIAYVKGRTKDEAVERFRRAN